MNQNPYQANLTPPALVKAPAEMSDVELDFYRFSPRAQQERQHRQMLGRIDALAAAQADLKKSVDRLAKPHWVVWATLAAGTIAAVASVLALFR